MVNCTLYSDFAAFAPEKTAFENSVVEDLAIK